MKIKLLAAAALALPLATSCLGPNNAHDGLRNWNATVTETEWVNEVIFLGMNIIPVYGLAYFGDVVIFNTIDYWSGDNPFADPGPFPHAAFGGEASGE
tara:strand:- start:7496 stop:7789 length:294 start_codon:yes stop_codon:yes gene_type:complete